MKYFASATICTILLMGCSMANVFAQQSQPSAMAGLDVHGNQQIKHDRPSRNLSAGSLKVERKSRGKSLLLAIGHTIGPIGLGLLARQSGNSSIRTLGTVSTAYGAFVGPSAGNIYAHDLNRGLIGVGVRTVGVGAMVAALSLALDGLYEEDDSGDTASTILTVTGLTAFVGSAIWNIYTAPISADEYNRENGLEVSLGPGYWPGPDAAGLRVRVTF